MFFSMSFLIPKKELKKMQKKPKIILDISVLDNDFYLSILNTILEMKKSKEAENGLQKDKSIF